MLRGDESPGHGELDVGPDVSRPLAGRAVHLAPRLTFLALHPAVAVLAVLAVVAPVPGEAVAVSLERLAPVTVEAPHPALHRGGRVSGYFT